MAGRLLALLCLTAALPAATGADGILFRRVDWGIDFRHHDGSSGRHYIIETDGSGVVFFDYDGDGDDDVFLPDGTSLPGYEGPTPRSRLYRNDGGVFADVTDRSKIEIPVYASGGTAGDVDGDGDMDLYVTAFGPNLLFYNDGDGTFTETGAAAGVDEPLWSSSAGLADVDRDGDLDLYVVNYVDHTLENNKPCGDRRRRLVGYCGPDVYNPLPDRFYRNNGDGTFTDATREAGFGGAVGAGLALCFGDLDDDGWIDLYVANDLTPNFHWRNKGGTFDDFALISGTAFGNRGMAEAGMGIAIGDYDQNGTLDLAVTNYEGETNALYSNVGGGIFTDRRFVSGLAEPSLRSLAFGIVAGDFDHDGDLDLVTANGHLRENAALFDPLSRYRQPNQVFENLGNGRFREVTEPGLSYVGASRGLAAGDLDGDGDLDLVITNVNDEVEVYENLRTSGAWLQVDVRGRFAIGTRIAVRQKLREVVAGSSYMSQSSLVVHFGLGQATRTERIRVRFGDGGIRVMAGLPVGRRIVLRR